MRKSIILCLFLIVVVAGSAFSQFDVGLNGLVISPQSGFKENVDRLGIGLAGMFAYKFEESPFLVGLSIGGGNYGSDSRHEPFSTTIPDVSVEVTTSNNILFSHLLLQARGSSGPVQPYVEGLLGFNYLWTETKIEDIDDYDDEEIASQTNFDDFAWSYGGGFGLLIKLATFDMDEGDAKEGKLFLDLKVRYLYGSEAEYLKEGSIKRSGTGKVTYDVNKSDTDLMSFHIGVVLQIN
jgi:hypothetical protein